MAMKQFGAKSTLTRYAQAPFSVLESGLSSTSILLFIRLLDTVRMSQEHSQFIDERGVPYAYVSLETMSKWTGVSKNQVGSLLNTLENEGWIYRRRMGLGQPNRIYILLPEESVVDAEQLLQQ